MRPLPWGDAGSRSKTGTVRHGRRGRRRTHVVPPASGGPSVAAPIGDRGGSRPTDGSRPLLAGGAPGLALSRRSSSPGRRPRGTTSSCRRREERGSSRALGGRKAGAGRPSRSTSRHWQRRWPHPGGRQAIPRSGATSAGSDTSAGAQCSGSIGRRRTRRMRGRAGASLASVPEICASTAPEQTTTPCRSPRLSPPLTAGVAAGGIFGSWSITVHGPSSAA